jgi:uncharacterized protein (TIRG00374 family)
MNDALNSTFKKSRILIAVFIGVLITSAFLVYSLNKHEFRRVEAGQGQYNWRDTNQDGKINTSDPNEFIAVPAGEYEKINALEVLQKIDWSSDTFFWGLFAIMGMVGRDFGYMLRIRLLTEKALSWRQSFRVIMTWEFASALAPGVVSGATVAMFILNREKIALGRATAIVILTAFFDNLFYVLFIPLLFILLPADSLFPKTGISDTLSLVFWSGYSIFALLCATLFLSIFIYPKLIGKILGSITKPKWMKRFREGALKTGTDLETTALTFRDKTVGFWLKVFGATILSWSSRFLVINFILQAFLHLNLIQQVQVFFKQFVLWMFLRVSPTPGGSGVAEWSFGELMSDFSDSFVLLATMAVLWRLISYFPYLFIGSILLPRWLKRR